MRTQDPPIQGNSILYYTNERHFIPFYPAGRIIHFDRCIHIWSGLLFSAFKGAPYVPTAKKEIAEVLKKAKLKKGKKFVEFGSGDGRIVRQAVKEYGVVGVGVEINPLLIWWSRFLARRDGTAQSVSFLKTDVFAYPLTEVDYLYVFLMPELLMKLMPKFQKELKPGALIISHGFKLTGMEKKLIHTNPSKAFSTYYYQV